VHDRARQEAEEDLANAEHEAEHEIAEHEEHEDPEKVCPRSNQCAQSIRRCMLCRSRLT
jgi:hypothetical protein